MVVMRYGNTIQTLCALSHGSLRQTGEVRKFTEKVPGHRTRHGSQESQLNGAPSSVLVTSSDARSP